MTWVRMEDGYPINRKVAALSDAAFRLDFEAICWSNRELADGQVRARELTQIRSKATRKYAGELVSAGRWHPAGQPCPSDKCPASPASASPATNTDGWVIHDYFDQQPTRARVLADRAVKAERQRNWMAKRQASRGFSGASTGSTSGAPTGPPTDMATGAATGAATGRVTGAHPAPVPAPPRPEGKRGGDLPEAPDARRQAADAAAAGWSKNQDQRPPPPPTNGRATVEAQAAIRARIAEARHRGQTGTRPLDDPLAELRQATPDIPPLLEPEVQAVVDDTVRDWEAHRDEARQAGDPQP